MSQKVFRSYEEPDREEPSWAERWKGYDEGLITCWEVGRRLRAKEPELAKRAEKGELPVLSWKGGVDKEIQKVEKQGTLFYLAQWQGLRGNNLEIDPSRELELTCSKTGMRVIFTKNLIE